MTDLISQLLNGNWGSLAMNPQLWLGIALAIYTVLKLIDPVAAKKHLDNALTVAAKIREIADQLYWTVEEVSRRQATPMSSVGKSQMFNELVKSEMKESGIEPTNDKMAIALNTAKAINAKRKVIEKNPTGASRPTS